MQQTETVPHTLVVRPEHDIVVSYVEEFRRQLQELVTRDGLHLVIDLAQVGMIDSRGLAVFMMCHKSLAARAGRLTVVTSNADFLQLFQVTRLDEHFTVTSAIPNS